MYNGYTQPEELTDIYAPVLERIERDPGTTEDVLSMNMDTLRLIEDHLIEYHNAEVKHFENWTTSACKARIDRTVNMLSRIARVMANIEVELEGECTCRPEVAAGVADGVVCDYCKAQLSEEIPY